MTGPAHEFAFEQMLDAIATESHRLATAVAAQDLDARVPSCPKWSVRDLAHHIGEVQWYWGQNVLAKNADTRSGGELTTMPDDTDLLAWLGWCTYTLLGALREAGPDAPCWAWWPAPRTAGAVGRHQAQEVSVHRWDAEGVAGAGASGPLESALATDGVPEFIDIMVGEDQRALPGAVTLTATDTGGTWRIAGQDVTSTGRTSELRATASDLVLMLYRRLPVPDIDVVGDPILVAALLSLADTS
ncbi:MAG TPA: maleylpyruvate isomerase N-terminal domain-containing protein [Acidimicrobiales bacterium]|nr:maleylpyruvate isomerase N-terminal domain-containing protein [Acidimicrobiales bacterium]